MTIKNIMPVMQLRVATALQALIEAIKYCVELMAISAKE